jgi:hypothetical protein
MQSLSLQAQRIEAVLAQRVKAVSQKLGPSLRSHARDLNADLIACLNSHSRTSLAYERQILRDLEAIRGDLHSIPLRPAGEIVYVHQPTSAAPVPQRPNLSVTASGTPIRPPQPPLSPSSSSASALSSPLTQSQSPLPPPSVSSSSPPPPAVQPAMRVYQTISPSSTPPPLRHGLPSSSSSGRLPSDGTQSMFLPTDRPRGVANHHNHNLSSSRISDLAKSVSVQVTGGGVVDERHRVDARMAASKLANMF